LDQFRANPLLWAIPALVLVGLVVGGIWIIARARRRNISRALGFDPAVFDARCPVLTQVLSTLGRKGLAEELARLQGIGEAVEILRVSARKRKSGKPDLRSSLVDVSGGGEPRVDAAILTLLRAVVMDERLYSVLPPEVVRSLDSFLDSLTD